MNMGFILKKKKQENVKNEENESPLMTLQNENRSRAASNALTSFIPISRFSHSASLFSRTCQEALAVSVGLLMRTSLEQTTGSAAFPSFRVVYLDRKPLWTLALLVKTRIKRSTSNWEQNLAETTFGCDAGG